MQSPVSLVLPQHCSPADIIHATARPSSGERHEVESGSRVQQLHISDKIKEPRKVIMCVKRNYAFCRDTTQFGHNSYLTLVMVLTDKK